MSGPSVPSTIRSKALNFCVFESWLTLDLHKVVHSKVHRPDVRRALEPYDTPEGSHKVLVNPPCSPCPSFTAPKSLID